MSTADRGYKREPSPKPATYSDVYRQVVISLVQVEGASFDELCARLWERLVGVQYQVIGNIPQLRMVAIELAETEDVFNLLHHLNSLEDLVSAAEQNHPMRLGAVVDDPLFWDQWALPKISAPLAWDRAVSAGPVIVAIVDTGIKTTHPDLAGHLWTDPVTGAHGFNVLTGTTDVEDTAGHGTMLAGTIGAISNNTLGIAAAEWPIQLMAVKFNDVRTPVTVWHGTLAIVWAVLHGAHVINASWDVGLPLIFLKVAIQFANSAGVVFVAGAGNDGLDNGKLPTYPASYKLPNVISVMASNEHDDKPGFSNYGETTVHLGAPGVRVLSTENYFTAPRWRRYSGTSAACAHVSNAAALVKALNPGAAPKDIRDHLMASADPAPCLSCISHGRLNLARAAFGPLKLTAPLAGDLWLAGTAVSVSWDRQYTTPLCATVSVLLSDGSGPYGVLKSGQPNTGICTVTAPNRNIAQARLKLQSDQSAGLFDESGIFAVTL